MSKSHLENFFAAILRTHRIRMVREYRFHPVRKWRFDFADPKRKIAVEIEGGVWTGGRHTRGAGYRADCQRYNAAVCLGWRVLRYTGPSDMADFPGHWKELTK